MINEFLGHHASLEEGISSRTTSAKLKRPKKEIKTRFTDLNEDKKVNVENTTKKNKKSKIHHLVDNSTSNQR